MSDILLWMHPPMQVCAAVLGYGPCGRGEAGGDAAWQEDTFPVEAACKARDVGPSFYGFWGARFYVTLDLFGSTHYRTARRTGVADHRLAILG